MFSKTIRTYLCISLLLFSFNIYNQTAFKTIIIDPGHGRPDIGAQGSFSNESQVTLDFGIKLEEAIKKRFPDVNVLLTRRDDFLPQHIDNSPDGSRIRAQMANQNKGDLFISIHADSEPQKYKKTLIGTTTKNVIIIKNGKKTTQPKVVNVYKKIKLPHTKKGSSFYIIAAHKSQDKNESIIENLDVILDDSMPQQELKSPELTAMASIYQKKFFRKSLLFASLLHEEFKRKKRISHGVKQRKKGIWVLQATSMPSVLIETGYICTNSEEIYLNSKDGQDELVGAIIIALANYKKLIESNTYTIPQELLVPEIPYNEEYEQEIIPATERVEKIQGVMNVTSESLRVELRNTIPNDKNLYSVSENTIYIDKKQISDTNPSSFELNIQKNQEIDLTISAEKLEGKNSGNLILLVFESDKYFEAPIVVTKTENARIIIKRH